MTISSDIQELKVLLRRGRHDYDYVAGVVYAACYNDPHVLQKILAAKPEDAPSSESEKGALSDQEDSEEEHNVDDGHSDVPQKNEETPTAKQSGSKEDPVLLDANVKRNDRKNKSGKRKRATSDVRNESLGKKTKHQNTLLLCLNCCDKFNPEKNEPDACRFHPAGTVLGELEDNPLDDQITDDEDSRETWPEAFQWECCETSFEEDQPCENGQHRADGGQKTEYAERREKEKRHKKYYG